MEQFLGTEYPPDQRAEFLESNCDSIEKKGYMKRFTPDELEQMRVDLADVSIQMNDINDEKSEVVKVFKEKLKPLVQALSELLRNIKTKSVFVEEECYKFIDQEARRTGFYNQQGILVDERQSFPDEMQKTIFSIERKSGTHN